jgi:hypothetical protein
MTPYYKCVAAPNKTAPGSRPGTPARTGTSDTNCENITGNVVSRYSSRKCIFLGRSGLRILPKKGKNEEEERCLQILFY